MIYLKKSYYNDMPKAFLLTGCLWHGVLFLTFHVYMQEKEKIKFQYPVTLELTETLLNNCGIVLSGSDIAILRCKSKNIYILLCLQLDHFA